MVQNEDDPTKVTLHHVFMMASGSDTTSVSLSSILYNLI